MRFICSGWGRARSYERLVDALIDFVETGDGLKKFLAFKVCFYDTLVPAREYKSGYAADRFARKCAAQGLWCSLHGLAVVDGGCKWVEISAC